MYEKLVTLGGTVPPDEYVIGCDPVCAKVKEMKDYWQKGEHADHACEVGRKYQCAWATVPPTTLATIGC